MEESHFFNSPHTNIDKKQHHTLHEQQQHCASTDSTNIHELAVNSCKEHLLAQRNHQVSNYE